jgi:hypothetical protein
MGLLQILELMPPVSPSFDYADATFYLTGERLKFEHLQVASPTLRLNGEGEMNFDTLELATRFHSRGSLFLVSDLVTILSDQIFEIEVTGPLASPQARIIGLPAFSPPLDPARSGPDSAKRVVSEPIP